MKFTLALFLGVVTAKDLQVQQLRNRINALKIKISEEGQRAIEKEAHDVGAVAHAIKDSRPVRNLGASFERWAESAEVQNIKALDEAFVQTPEGKRLVREWQDVGEVLHEMETFHNGKDTIHIDNAHLHALEDELTDVAAEYKKLEGSEWDKAYHQAWGAALSNKQAKALERRAKTFKKSAEGQALGKEVKELGEALKTHVKVSDVPESWKKDMNMLKVTVHNKEAIEKEWTDVENVWGAIKDSRPVRNLGASLERWGESAEVQNLKALDKKFVASPEGQELVREWEDVFKSLDGAVYHNDSGFHIDNAALQTLEDELDDVADQYEDLEMSHWAKEYEAAWGAAVSNKQAKSLERRAKSFKKSAEGAALKKEMKEFGKSLKENVKVTDIPEHWKEDMTLF